LNHLTKNSQLQEVYTIFLTNQKGNLMFKPRKTIEQNQHDIELLKIQASIPGHLEIFEIEIETNESTKVSEDEHSATYVKFFDATRSVRRTNVFDFGTGVGASLGTYQPNGLPIQLSASVEVQYKKK
jgi:hypothetical protein